MSNAARSSDIGVTLSPIGKVPGSMRTKRTPMAFTKVLPAGRTEGVLPSDQHDPYGQDRKASSPMRRPISTLRLV